MEINGKTYGYTIRPMFGKVNAEIWYKWEDLNMRLLSKEFGSIFRKPIKEDYEKAEDWVKLQMECIKKANSLTL